MAFHCPSEPPPSRWAGDAATPPPAAPPAPPVPVVANWDVGDAPALVCGFRRCCWLACGPLLLSGPAGFAEGWLQHGWGMDATDGCSMELGGVQGLPFLNGHLSGKNFSFVRVFAKKTYPFCQKGVTQAGTG